MKPGDLCKIMPSYAGLQLDVNNPYDAESLRACPGPMMDTHDVVIIVAVMHYDIGPQYRPCWVYVMTSKGLGWTPWTTLLPL